MPCCRAHTSLHCTPHRLSGAYSWERYSLRPRVLNNVADCDTSTTVLGSAVSSPICVAPFAGSRIVHPDGELAIGRAAARKGFLYAFPHYAGFPIEKMKELSTMPPMWFQLYPPRCPLFLRSAFCALLVLRAQYVLYALIALDRCHSLLCSIRCNSRRRFELAVLCYIVAQCTLCYIVIQCCTPLQTMLTALYLYRLHSLRCLPLLISFTALSQIEWFRERRFRSPLL